MSTIKISQLNPISAISSNTANTILIALDIPSGTTGKINAFNLARGLYTNNQLNVGNNPDQYPNTVAQFAGTSNNYVQINFENINNEYGTADYVVGANTGSDSTYYMSMGYSNSKYNPNYPNNSLGTVLNPLDGYIYVQGSSGNPGGNLVMGTTTSSANIVLFAGGNTSSQLVGRLSNTSISWFRDAIHSSNVTATKITLNGNTPSTTNATGTLVVTGGVGVTGNVYSGNITITGSSNTLTFADGSTQSVAASPANYSQAAFTTANNALANTSGTFNGNLTLTGNVVINGTTTPSKGIIVSPTLLPGAQTAITVDFANNSLIRANTSAGVTVSFTNYVAGKVVEMWITNTSGTNQTFNHGVPAINSTINSTSYAIPGTSSIYVKYFSFNNDVGNTFVSIVHQ